jgi:hypothetical protein
MLKLHLSELSDGCPRVTTYRELDFKQRIMSAKHGGNRRMGRHGHCVLQKGKRLIMKPSPEF